MRRSIGFATVAALTAAHPCVALGQSSKVPNPPEQSVQAEVKKALEAAGFKDVKVEPGTFAVHATDPSGSPVMMVINPDTFGSDTEHETTPSLAQRTYHSPQWTTNEQLAPCLT